MFTTLLVSSVYLAGSSVESCNLSRFLWLFVFALSSGVALVMALVFTGKSIWRSCIKVGNSSTISTSTAQAAVPEGKSWISDT
uniref:Putative secreted protein n=1 Tax=Ixodes ricinus TaxID=34613 RepID=A0A6B0UE95_IXORI